MALSNAGATLLQRKAYQSAQQALKEALSRMRVFFTNIITADPQGNIDDKVKVSDKHIALTPPLPHLDSSHDQCIEISLHDISYPTMLELLLCSSLSTKTTFASPIRIVNCSSHYTMEDVELISSVVLFNFGIARRLLSCGVQTNTTEGTYTLEASRELLLFSLTSLQAQYARCCSDEAHVVLILFVSSLALGNLVHISTELGDLDGVAAHSSALVLVQQVAHTMREDFSAILCESLLELKTAPAA